MERVDASQNQGCLNHKHSIQAVENSACRGESVKLGTEAHYWLYVKNFKGDTPRKSRDC